MTRTLIKICGVTRVEDAESIVDLDVDVIGLNFVAKSPRSISVMTAREIQAALRSRNRALSIWAVFADAVPEHVAAVISEITPDVLQFHGEETPEYCRQFARPYVKVVPMRPGVSIAEMAEGYDDATMLLLDTWTRGHSGGTGTTFDWSLWPRKCTKPLMLAGGLDPENVASAVQRLSPAAVDVAGGVEGGIKGIKDLERCRRFVEAVRMIDQQLERSSK